MGNTINGNMKEFIFLNIIMAVGGGLALVLALLVGERDLTLFLKAFGSTYVTFLMIYYVVSPFINWVEKKLN